MASIGHFVDGKYEILRPISKGGMGAVFLARDRRLKKLWAVKEIPLFVDGKENSRAIDAALKEAEIIKRLDYPAIVRIVDVFSEENSLYIVEDYIDGTSLKSVAARGGYGEREVVDWALSVCDCLLYLHGLSSPVIYRDLKPSNLILTENGSIRFIDFGAARIFKPGKDEDTACLGTRKFAAPEQFKGAGRQTDQRTDIYGFGSTFRYMTAGIKVSFGLKFILKKCMRKEPEKRYQRVGDVKAALERLKALKKKKRISLFRILIIVFIAVCAFVVFMVAAAQKRNKESLIEEFYSMAWEVKRDGIFSIDEEKKVLEFQKSKLNDPANQVYAEEISFEIGKLYWFYYEYGSENGTGKKEAAYWFEKCEILNETAAVLKSMAVFYRDINMKISEGTDDGLFR